MSLIEGLLPISSGVGGGSSGRVHSEDLCEQKPPMIVGPTAQAPPSAFLVCVLYGIVNTTLFYRACLR